MRAAAEALRSPRAGHLAGAEWGGGGARVPARRRRPAGRWAATPRGPEGAVLTAEPSTRQSGSGGRVLPEARV